VAGQGVEYLLRVVDEASEPLASTGDEAEKTEVSLAALGAQLAAVVGVVGGLVAGFVSLNQAVADSINDLNDMSVRTGVTAQRLAGMKLAIEGAGGSIEGLEGSVRRMVQTMADAQQGVSTAVDSLEFLGLTVDDVTNGAGGIISADEAMVVFGDAIMAIEDPTQRSAAALEVFGRSAGKMLQAGFLGDMDHFVDLAREYGVDVGPAASAEAAAWQRNMALFDATMETIPQRLLEAFGGEGAQLLGEFTEDLNDLLDVASAVAGPMRQLGDVLETGFGHLSRFVPLFTDLRDVAKSFSEVDFGAFADLFGGGGGTFTFPTGSTSEAGNTRANPITRGGTGTSVDIAAGAAAADAAAKAAGGGKPPTVDAEPYVIPIVDQIEAMGFVIDETARVNVDAINAQSAMLDASLADLAELARMELEAVEANRAAAGGDIASAGGQVASGDALGMLAGMGGTAALGAGVGMGLSAIGQAGAGGVATAFEQQAKDIVAGLEAMPVILADVLPEVITEAIPKLTIALVEALPVITIAMLEGFVKLTIELPIAFTVAMIKALFSWWNEAVEVFAGARDTIQSNDRGENAMLAGRVTLALATMGLSEAAIWGGKKVVGSFDTGSRYVNETGMAMVHKREQIYAPGQSGPMGGAVNIVLENHGVMVQGGLDGLRRELQDIMGDLGYGGTLTPATVG